MTNRNPKAKLLLGPGPSSSDPRVLRALSEPTLGHLDPEFIAIMDETTELLRYVFNTRNKLTLPISGTGSAGMEAAIVNMVEPGDKVIICSVGYFGDRMVQVAERVGAIIVKLESPWGQIISVDDVKKAIKNNPDAKVLGIVHAETSTGVLQPLGEIAAAVHDAGMRIVVDAVTSLGGMDVPVDRLNLDFVYSGTQKCLNCPPGLAPITVSDSSAELIAKRQSKCLSWYLDLSLIQQYWGLERFYHHTAPINMIYALHEALSIVKEEGLEARFERHRNAQAALLEGLSALGLEPVVEKEYRLPSLTTVWIPEGVDDARVRKTLLEEFEIEIGAGLGVFKGKVWRFGLMGVNARHKNVVNLLAALKDILSR